MEKISYKYLNFISFEDLIFWSASFLRSSKSDFNQRYKNVKIGELLFPIRDTILVKDNVFYKQVRVKVNGQGVVLRDEKLGKDIGTKKQFKVKENQFIISKIDARNGAFGIIPKELNGAIVTNDFPVFDVSNSMNIDFLFLLSKTDLFTSFAKTCSSGTTNRQRIDISKFLDIKIPLPSLAEQEAIVNAYENKIQQADQLEKQADQLEIEIENYLFSELGIEKPTPKKEKIKGLQFVQFKDLERWDGKKNYKLNSLYRIEKIGKYIQNISTGTTPPTIRKEYFEGDVNFYTPSDLGEDMFLSNSERKISNLALKHKKSRRFEKGTILFVGIGSTIGKVGIVENNYASSNQQITGFFVNDNYLINSYVYYYFDYFKHITTKEQTKATIPIVNQEKILNILIPIPPLEKQQEIVDYISALKVQIKDKKNTAEQLKHQAQTDFENQIFS